MKGYFYTPAGLSSFFISLFIFFSGSTFGRVGSVAENISHQNKVDQARELVDKYGAAGRLNLSGLKNYLNTTAFSAIDTDEDGELSFNEYYAAFLYCVPGTVNTEPDCDSTPVSASTRFTAEISETDDRAITGQNLAQVNRFWTDYIDAKSKLHGSYIEDELNDNGSAWGIDQIVEYLAVVDSKKKRPTVQQRMKGIKRTIEDAESGSSTVSEDTLDEFFRKEVFHRADIDGSGDLDIFEAKTAFPVEGFVKSFVEIVKRDPINKHLRIELVKFMNLEGEGIDDLVRIDIMKARNEIVISSRGSIGSPPLLTLESLEKQFDSQYRAETKALNQAAKKKLDQEVSGYGWVQHRGLVFGERKYDQVDKKVDIDWRHNAVIFRLIEDFTKADDKAKPAMFSVSKSSGENSEKSIDAAVRLDWYNPSLYGFGRDDNHRVSPAIGAQWNEGGSGEKRKNTKQAFLLLDWFWDHEGSYWKSSQFQIGPVFQRDDVADIDKLTGLVEVEPLLGFGEFSTGVRMPLSGSGNNYYLRPRAALELGEIVDSPDGTDEPDTTFGRLGLEIGFTFFDRFELVYDAKYYIGLSGDRSDHFFHKTRASWNLDKEKRFSITATYQNGEEAPAFGDVEVISAGLGVRF